MKPVSDPGLDLLMQAHTTCPFTKPSLKTKHNTNRRNTQRQISASEKKITLVGFLYDWEKNSNRNCWSTQVREWNEEIWRMIQFTNQLLLGLSRSVTTIQNWLKIVLFPTQSYIFWIPKLILQYASLIKSRTNLLFLGKYGKCKQSKTLKNIRSSKIKTKSSNSDIGNMKRGSNKE